MKAREGVGLYERRGEEERSSSLLTFCQIIDQDVAFLGGLDLCFGRFDSILSEHLFLLLISSSLLPLLSLP